MKKRTEALLHIGLCLGLGSGSLLLLVIGCSALKRNSEWQAVFFIMGSLYMMLIVHALQIAMAIKYGLERKAKQEEREDREETRDGGAVEEVP